MADRGPGPVRRMLAMLPFALPVFGGIAGIAWTNMTPHGSPILGIAAGAAIGGLAAAAIVRLAEAVLDARAQRSGRKREQS